MTERPCELLHMDLVGPAHVWSVGRKLYVLVVVDDYSRYAWVFFLTEKWETFGFVQDLVLRLKNEMHKDAIWVIRSDNGSEIKNSRFETFCHDLCLKHRFSSPYTPSWMAWWKGKIEPCVRWLGRCLMSIGLWGGSGLRRSIPCAMCRISVFFELSRIRHLWDDARSHSQGESFSYFQMQMLYFEVGKKSG
jgi:hypothetical protein